MVSPVLAGRIGRGAVVALLALLALSGNAAETSHGKDASPLPEPMIVTVNLGPTLPAYRVLQIRMMFEYASPLIALRLANIKPKVQHELIMMVSSEEGTSLLSSAGKNKLRARIGALINALLKETSESGVTDVLFTDFVIATF
jgi:flagellar FliL protein